jgi:hypothetical protein
MALTAIRLFQGWLPVVFLFQIICYKEFRFYHKLIIRLILGPTRDLSVVDGLFEGGGVVVDVVHLHRQRARGAFSRLAEIARRNPEVVTWHHLAVEFLVREGRRWKPRLNFRLKLFQTSFETFSNFVRNFSLLRLKLFLTSFETFLNFV